MTLPAEPIYIGGQPVLVKFFAMPRRDDEPPRIEGVLTLIAGEGVLTLDALVGPQGIPGEPSPIIRPQWGSTVTAPEDLPDPATLNETDDGRAWYINGQWYVYGDNLGDYHIIQGSIPGPPGATPDISVSAELVEAPDPVVYGPITVTESGTSTAPHFHIEIPGVPGPQGPSAAVNTASDVDNTDFAVGKILAVIDDSPRIHGYIDQNPIVPRLYTIPHQSFVDHTGSEGRFLIASLNIPAQTFDWYPDVNGHIHITKSGLLSSVQVEVEVRIGDTGAGTGETDPLCGLAPYDPTMAVLDAVTIAHILPHFSDTGNPSRAIAPDSSVGRVLAGQAKTIYVFIHKIAGSGNYQFTKDTAQVRIMCVPAPELP